MKIISWFLSVLILFSLVNLKTPKLDTNESKSHLAEFSNYSIPVHDNIDQDVHSHFHKHSEEGEEHEHKHEHSKLISTDMPICGKFKEDTSPFVVLPVSITLYSNSLYLNTFRSSIFRPPIFSS